MKECVCEKNFMRNYTSRLVTRGKNKKGVLNRIIYIQVLEIVYLLHTRLGDMHRSMEKNIKVATTWSLFLRNLVQVREK